jgi:uncharacterized protein YnzC (UPF0291/DUF896 family)
MMLKRFMLFFFIATLSLAAHADSAGRGDAASGKRKADELTDEQKADRARMKLRICKEFHPNPNDCKSQEAEAALWKGKERKLTDEEKADRARVKLHICKEFHPNPNDCKSQESAR